MKAFAASQFSCCPLVWIHCRTMKHRLNKIDKRAFQLVHGNSLNLPLEMLLVIDNSVSTHLKNLTNHKTKFFKSKNGISPKIMDGILHFIEKLYNLQNSTMHITKRT